MYLIVGLGNPGEEYRLTRHNVGFLILDRLIQRLQPSSISKKSFKGELYRSGSIFLLKPLTYMNLSGESVQAVMHYYRIELQNLIVVHDDLDLALGALRFKRGGGSGGHNGLKSIDKLVGSEYLRVRFGIGRPQNKEEVIRYVLSPFSEGELACIEPAIERAAEAALALTKEPLARVQERYSQRGIEC